MRTPIVLFFLTTLLALLHIATARPLAHLAELHDQLHARSPHGAHAALPYAAAAPIAAREPEPEPAPEPDAIVEATEESTAEVRARELKQRSANLLRRRPARFHP